MKNFGHLGPHQAVQLLVAGLFMVYGDISFSAPQPFRQEPPSKPQILQPGSVVRGGLSARAKYSLLDLRHSKGSTAQVERLVFDIGDGRGLPSTGRVGYFNLGYNAKTKELILDLPQLSYLKVDNDQLNARIKASRFISSVRSIFDPVDLSTTIIFKLKTDITVKVFDTVGGKSPAKLVLDLRPANLKIQ
jgi:hypothetical protein